jgi:hypothetical protein
MPGSYIFLAYDSYKSILKEIFGLVTRFFQEESIGKLNEEPL